MGELPSPSLPTPSFLCSTQPSMLYHSFLYSCGGGKQFGGWDVGLCLVRVVWRVFGFLLSFQRSVFVLFFTAASLLCTVPLPLPVTPPPPPAVLAHDW